MRTLRSHSFVFVGVLLALSCGAGAPTVRQDEARGDESGRTWSEGSSSGESELGGRMPGTLPAPRPPADEPVDRDPEPIAPDSVRPPVAPSVSGPSDPFAAGILAAHNRVRAGVSPAASPALAPLVWDENLARLAGDWTSRCPDGHRPENDYGENMYWSGGMPASPEDAVESWAEEARNYDYRSTVCSRDGRRDWSACGHYTQIVWRNTARVGCAIRTNCPGDFENVVVCNYDPPGNYNVTSTSIPRPY